MLLISVKIELLFGIAMAGETVFSKLTIDRMFTIYDYVYAITTWDYCSILSCNLQFYYLDVSLFIPRNSQILTLFK